jgi:hypothetical protein
LPRPLSKLPKVLIPFLIIAAAGVLAYSNSFSVPFLLDDDASIRDNRHIRHLWPLSDVIQPPHQASMRPVVNVSLAVDYALHDYDVRGYHVFNLAVHVLAALVLFGVVRRTLEREPARAFLAKMK